MWRHHSLVTPIDWKRGWDLSVGDETSSSHHSLVTPIDWKHRNLYRDYGGLDDSKSPLAGDTY